MTKQIKLPPLPEPLCNLPGHCRDAIAHYTNTAIEADRQEESTKKYQIGDETYQRVFKASGLTNLSDMQAVLDAVESALVEADRQRRGEPVLYQSRTRPIWVGASKTWTAWENCTKDQANDYRRLKVLHDWEYEVRELYLAPQPQQIPEGYKQTLKEFFVALDAAMDLDKSCSTYSSKPKGTLTERVTAWGEVNRLRAMLAKYGSHQIQEGYKLVPIEPTEAMLFACEDAGSISNHRRGKRIYKAMLEAAPEPKEKP